MGRSWDASKHGMVTWGGERRHCEHGRKIQVLSLLLFSFSLILTPITTSTPTLTPTATLTPLLPPLTHLLPTSSHSHSHTYPLPTPTPILTSFPHFNLYSHPPRPLLFALPLPQNRQALRRDTASPRRSPRCRREAENDESHRKVIRSSPTHDSLQGETRSRRVTLARKLGS